MELHVYEVATRPMTRAGREVAGEYEEYRYLVVATDEKLAADPGPGIKHFRAGVLVWVVKDLGPVEVFNVKAVL
jgi:hypothetical protein